LKDFLQGRKYRLLLDNESKPLNEIKDLGSENDEEVNSFVAAVKLHARDEIRADFTASKTHDNLLQLTSEMVLDLDKETKLAMHKRPELVGAFRLFQALNRRIVGLEVSIFVYVTSLLSTLCEIFEHLQAELATAEQNRLAVEKERDDAFASIQNIVGDEAVLRVLNEVSKGEAGTQTDD